MSFEQFKKRYPKLYKRAVNTGIDAAIGVYSKNYIFTPRPEAKKPVVDQLSVLLNCGASI